MSFFAILVSFEKENNGIKKAKINRIFSLIKNKILNNVNISPSGNVIIPGSFQVGANTTLGGDLIVLGSSINFSSIDGSGTYLGIDENGNLYKTTGGGGGVPDPLSIGTIQSTASDSILYINSNTGQDFTNGPTYIGTVDKDLILNGVIAITGDTSITGNTTINGNLQTINSGTMSSAGALSVLSGGANITGNTSITGDTTITGDTSINGNLQTSNSGMMSSAGALSVLSGGANITGNTSITGDTTITGDTNINGNLQTSNSGTMLSAGALSVLSGGASITGNTSITGNISIAGDTDITGIVNVNSTGDYDINIGNSDGGGAISIKTDESDINISTNMKSGNEGNISIQSAADLNLKANDIVYIGKNFPSSLTDCNVIINSSDSNSVLINCGYENGGFGDVEIGTDYDGQTSDSTIKIGGTNSHIYLQSAEIIPPTDGINKILYIDNNNKVTTTDYGENAKLRINLQTNSLTTNPSDTSLYINKYNVVTTKNQDPTEYDKQFTNLDSYPGGDILYINADGGGQPLPLGNTIIGNNNNDLSLYGDTEINADSYGEGSYTKIGYYVPGAMPSGSGEVLINSFDQPIQINSYGDSEVSINTDTDSGETEIGNLLKEVSIIGSVININSDDGSNNITTNIGTGGTTGAVKIGNTSNKVLIGKTDVAIDNSVGVNIASKYDVVSNEITSVDINVNNGAADTNIGIGNIERNINIGNCNSEGENDFISNVSIGHKGIATDPGINIGTGAAGSDITIGNSDKCGDITIFSSEQNSVNINDATGNATTTNIGTGGTTGAVKIGNTSNQVLIGNTGLTVGGTVDVNIASNGTDSVDINVNNSDAPTYIGTGSTAGNVMIGNASNQVLIGKTIDGAAGQVGVLIGSNGTSGTSVDINVDNGIAVTNIGTGSTTGAINIGNSSLIIKMLGNGLEPSENGYFVTIDIDGTLKSVQGGTSGIISANPVNINNNSSSNVTNIGTGNTTGVVKIGNSANQVQVGNTGLTVGTSVDVNIASSSTHSVDINVDNGSAVTRIGTGSTTGAINIGNTSSTGGISIFSGNGGVGINNNINNNYFDKDLSLNPINIGILYSSTGTTNKSAPINIGVNNSSWGTNTISSINIGCDLSTAGTNTINAVNIGFKGTSAPSSGINIGTGSATGAVNIGNSNLTASINANPVNINVNNSAATTYIGTGSTAGNVRIGNASNQVLIGGTANGAPEGVDVLIASNGSDSVNINVDNGGAITNIGTGTTTGRVWIGGNAEVCIGMSFPGEVPKISIDTSQFLSYQNIFFHNMPFKGASYRQGTYDNYKCGNLSITNDGAIYIDASSCAHSASEIKTSFEDNFSNINNQIFAIESNLKVSNEKFKSLEEKIIELEKVNKNIIEKNKKLEKLIKNIQEKKEKESQN
jgi:hypothetical protein